ncbi:hypothetical protein [Oleiharenicola sp. Vm1]|uniref:hypothetical protein n=1 Tax=Oleiharenicola sp. Vm1 TaxID=3398393 RepID=UPI0039F5ED92
MMITRRILGFTVGILNAAAVSAQTIQFVSVTRQANYVQTGATVSDRAADGTTPFQFRAAVEGSDSSPLTSTNPWTAVTVTLPSSATQALTFDTSNQGWYFKDSTPTSMSNLNATYDVGSYTFTPTGTPSTQATVTVASFASSLLNIPQLTLSGGSWINGAYVVSDTATLTVTFNAVFSGTPGASDSFHFDSSLDGQSNHINGTNDFVNWDATTNATANYASTPPDFVIGAGQLAAGSYTISASYNDVQNPTSVYGSAFAASLLEYRTQVNLTVVPEPSATATAFGVFVLLFATRRRSLRAA